ncbi:MAG: hypothetical protein RQ833_08185 [Sphingomonadaceae bacterium]|nr:hypothetical protein [Sphingomonadaceae bacterium]
MILQSTPVLIVPKVEDSEPFFERLGFRRTTEVPHNGTIGFVIMTQDSDAGGDASLSVMLQTPEAAAADTGLDEERFPTGGAHLFLTTPDIGHIERVLDGFEVFLPRRDTFYGARETGWREPGGNYVTVAQFAANSPDEA